MEILHVSAECYPVAKAGGLGDVAGALPRYLNREGQVARLVMPMYRTRFLYAHQWDVVHKGVSNLGSRWFDFTVIREKAGVLGFELYLVDIHGLLDRERIYGYDDDIERFTAFQIAVLDWITSWKELPQIVHVHDHHTALIPFMMAHCHKYIPLRQLPTVLTVHNAEYQGWMGWDRSHYLPPWNTAAWGKLDWHRTINPLASGIKCASRVTTVSPTYLQELRVAASGLENLFEWEQGKCRGILNGIDSAVWDPATDDYLTDRYDRHSVLAGKAANKMALCDRFNLDFRKPLIVFIGRLVGEKGADLLPSVIADTFRFIGRRVSFLVLGSGNTRTEEELEALLPLAAGDYSLYIGYNEALSHQLYAGADFLLMPSRVEPCGLNQLYALRYGTVPVVRRTGGLRDTVVDFEDPGGYGVCFNHASTGDVCQAVWRCAELYRDRKLMDVLRDRMMQLDFDWQSSTRQYVNVYQEVTAKN